MYWKYASTIKVSKGVVVYKKMLRYLKVGQKLHMVSACSAAAFFLTGGRLLHAFEQGSGYGLLVYSIITGYGFILLFLAQMDAISRYQNYKRAKDQLYENGFKPRIVQLYMSSRCQRDAVKVAARDLGFHKELACYYETLGYRWFHLLPDFVFYKPFIICTRRYWQRTLFEKKYRLKHFLW